MLLWGGSISSVLIFLFSSLLPHYGALDLLLWGGSISSVSIFLFSSLLPQYGALDLGRLNRQCFDISVQWPTTTVWCSRSGKVK